MQRSPPYAASPLHALPVPVPTQSIIGMHEAFCRLCEHLTYLACGDLCLILKEVAVGEAASSEVQQSLPGGQREHTLLEAQQGFGDICRPSHIRRNDELVVHLPVLLHCSMLRSGQLRQLLTPVTECTQSKSSPDDALMLERFV